jgi:hypothetical protein
VRGTRASPLRHDELKRIPAGRQRIELAVSVDRLLLVVPEHERDVRRPAPEQLGHRERLLLLEFERYLSTARTSAELGHRGRDDARAR